MNYQGNKKENVKKNMVVQMLQYSLLRNQLSLKIHLTNIHMERWIDKLFCCFCCYCCFCGMVDRRMTFSLISSRDHCQRSSPSWISETPRAEFKPAQNLISSFVGSCALVITTTPRSKKHCTAKTLKKRST